MLECRRLKCTLKTLGLSLVLASPIAIAQQTPSNMGVLTCTLVPSEGEARPLSCGFKPTSTGGEGRYVGTIRESRARPQGKQILVWTVLAAGGMRVGPDALGQRFSSQPGEPGKLVGQTNWMCCNVKQSTRTSGCAVRACLKGISMADAKPRVDRNGEPDISKKPLGPEAPPRVGRTGLTPEDKVVRDDNDQGLGRQGADPKRDA